MRHQPPDKNRHSMIRPTYWQKMALKPSGIENDLNLKLHPRLPKQHNPKSHSINSEKLCSPITREQPAVRPTGEFTNQKMPPSTNRSSTRGCMATLRQRLRLQ